MVKKAEKVVDNRKKEAWSQRRGGLTYTGLREGLGGMGRKLGRGGGGSKSKGFWEVREWVDDRKRRRGRGV